MRRKAEERECFQAGRASSGAEDFPGTKVENSFRGLVQRRAFSGGRGFSHSPSVARLRLGLAALTLTRQNFLLFLPSVAASKLPYKKISPALTHKQIFTILLFWLRVFRLPAWRSGTACPPPLHARPGLNSIAIQGRSLALR